MYNAIPVTIFRHQMGAYLKRVARGETIILEKSGIPVAMVLPISKDAHGVPKRRKRS